MAKTRRGAHPHQDTTPQNVPNTQAPATVASLGVRARLVRVDPKRERTLTDLIAACARLRQEWDRLLTQMVDRLHDEERDDRDPRPADPPADD